MHRLICHMPQMCHMYIVCSLDAGATACMHYVDQGLLQAPVIEMHEKF